MHVGDDIDQIENGKMPMKLYWFLFFSILMPTIKCIFLIQMFSSSDAHMKLYLLSFEWGEILYKNQKCKNFIYLSTFTVALKF